MPDLRALAAEVDAMLTGPALVYGSLPQDAHDVDLVVRPKQLRQLENGLAAAGFERGPSGWVRIRGARVDVVDPVDVAAWRLPPDRVEALFAAARPLEGCTRLAEPAPHHRLLILAPRVTRRAGPVETTKLARVRRAVSDDPDAFARAHAEALDWGCARQLETLDRVYAGQNAVGASDVWSALLLEQHRRGRHGPMAVAGAARQRLRRQRGAVVAISGLDGAGKSTQATQLAAALEALGHDTTVAWQRVTYDPSLDRLTAPVRAVLMRLRRTSSQPPVDSAELPADRVAAQALRQRYPFVGAVWVSIVAVRFAWQVRRATLAQVRRGVVVIRDRYELDTVVQLREQYGESLDVGRQVRLVRLLMPRAIAAFFLDVSAAEAWRRKPDEFDPDQLERQRRRYLAELSALGVERVDGERPADEVAELLLRRVSSRLNGG